MGAVVATATQPVLGVYLRVSTTEQNEANQEPSILQLIQSRYPGCRIVWYREKHSATKGRRAVYECMMADARAGAFTVLVIWRLDRLGRTLLGNLQAVKALDDAGVRVVSVCDPWLDTTNPSMRQKLLADFSWMAEEEGRIRAERVAEGVRRVTQAGGADGMKRPPFGMMVVRDAAKIPHLALNPDTLPWLHKMGRAFVACKTFMGTAKRMDAAGAPRWKDRPWNKKRVAELLKSPTLREHKAWPTDLLAKIDETLAEMDHAPARGAAAPAHLASSFLKCGLCGSPLTVKTKRVNGRMYSKYLCSRKAQHGAAACVGIGHRTEHEVNRALIEMVAGAITGEIRGKALALARARLDAQPDVASEREAVEAALKQAVAEGVQLGRAVMMGGKLEVLVQNLKANEEQKNTLRARLARLEASPVANLDTARKLALVEERLGALARALDEGGMAARPAVEAVLQGARLAVLPVVVDGVRRWGISGWIPSGYLLSMPGCNVGTFGGASALPPPAIASP